MRADSHEPHEVFLMINQETSVLYPLSSHALHLGQGALNSIVIRSRNELILDAEGTIWRIAEVRPVHDSFAARLRRLVGFAYEIEVDLQPHSVELGAFKSLLLKGLQRYTSTLDGDESWAFVVQPFPEIEVAVIEAEDLRSLYETLSLPSARYCLDVL